MKKILLIALIAFITNTKAQITFEFALDSASALTSTEDELMIINFELLGDEYVRINRHGQNISIYNMNHALVKTISYASFPVGMGSNNCIFLYFSQLLFNTDNKIEFMYGSQSANNPHNYTGIYNEDGTLLFSDTAWAAVYPTYPMQEYPIYNTSAGTKMILSYTNGQAKIFDLGGTLTTAIDRVNTHTNTGLGNAYPNPTTNSTTIPYTLPNGSNQGEVVFYNTQGVEVKRFKVDNTFNSLLISTSDILAGTYYYQLQINGSASATKKMVVIK
jgi:hypothetical protein